jgi:hypothetical protein
MTQDAWEFYEEPAKAQLEQKWGKTTFESIPYSYDDNGNVLTHETISKTEKVNTDEEKKQYSKEYRETLKRAREHYLKDKKDAYKFIAKNIDKWWD